MRLTSKGQVTIPKDLRDQLGLQPGTDVEFDVHEGDLIVRRADRMTPGQALVAHLSSFRGRTTMTTDELMALTRGED
jgi:AbrB family looped-hinge helix DNA binding protein